MNSDRARGIYRPHLLLLASMWVVSWGELCCPLKAQTDASAAFDAVARMPSVPSAQISSIPDYKTVALPRPMFGYDRLMTQTVTTRNAALNLSTANSVSTINQGVPPNDDGLALFYQIPDDQLFLEILPATNGTPRLLLHGTTNEVYELMSKISLSDNAWRPEQTLHRTNDEHQIYTVVSFLDRTNTLFFWARDWTQIDENHDGIPDWWEWEHFGDLSINVNQDYDGDGMSIRDEYFAHNDPNKIRFNSQTDSFEVNHRRVKIRFDVSKGHPASMAVLVDSTNFAEAVWRPIRPEVEVDLGPAEGWHEVRVGLRGRATTSMQTWKWNRFRLDMTPPKLTITAPVTLVTAGKYVQIEGDSSESLSEIKYDDIATNGMKTNQLVVTSYRYDEGYAGAVHHIFQCVDVELTPGTNEITIHAADLAGNTASAKILLNLDPLSATNPPVIKLHWPQNGTRIAGKAFGWRGWISDPNGAIEAAFIGTDGSTNTIQGIIERDGSFWVNDVPLHVGTNSVSLIASNASGLSIATNIAVVGSDVMITIDQLTPADTAVSGTISQPGYAVWVNGVKTKTDSDGRWDVEGVPQICSQSDTTVILQVRAIPDSDHGGNGIPANVNPAATSGVDVEATAVVDSGTYVRSHFKHEHIDYLEPHLTQDGSQVLASDEEISWVDGGGGKRAFKEWIIQHGVTNLTLTETLWAPSRWPQPIPPGVCRSWSAATMRWQTNSVPVSPPFDPARLVHADVDFVTADGDRHVRLTEDVKVSLSTGGRAIPGRAALFSINTWAKAVEDEDLPVPTSKPIPPEETSVGVHGQPRSDGKLWIVFPEGLR